MDKTDSWTVQKLGTICDWGSGGTPLSSVKEYYNGNIKWAIIGDLNGSIIYNTQKSISKKGLENSSAKLVPKNTLLIGMYGSIGKTAITGNEMATNQAIAFAIPKDKKVNIYFLKYFIELNVSNLFKLSKGGTQKNISQEILKNFEMPLPKIEEQESIVLEIEKQLTKLEKSIETMKKVKSKLEFYKKIILKESFDGFETIQLSKISELITKGASPKWQGISYTKNKEVLFITSENVRNGFLDIHSPKYVELKFNEKQKRSILKNGDLLLNIVGASIGRASIYSLSENANINQAVSVIRLKDPTYKDFICYFLNSPLAQAYYNKEKVDVARANLSLEDVSKIPIPMPQKNKIEEIVQEIDSKLSLIEKTEKTVEQSLMKADLLRKSILKSAFEGKLVNV